MNEAEREIPVSFWKVHILHHGGEEPIHGQWVLNELRRHGYDISPGTLYPLLERMERRGWLKDTTDPNGGLRARKDYELSGGGRKVLELVQESLIKLNREVVLEGKKEK